MLVVLNIKSGFLYSDKGNTLVYQEQPGNLQLAIYYPERVKIKNSFLDIPLLLPDVKDLQDACVTRLVRLLERRDGVARVHVMRPGEPADAAANAGRASPIIARMMRQSAPLPRLP